METIQNNLPNQDVVQNNQQEVEDGTEVKEVNLYPTIRHMFLILCILLTVAIIAFLFYQNGKSIYDNGL